MEKKKTTKELARELGLLRRKSKSQARSLNTGGKQPFQYIVVIDFESTCWKDQRFRSQEIIEFPAVLLNTSTGACESEFHYYIQPYEQPVLSDFCKELTGITQGQVEEGIPLSLCMKKFNHWIDRLFREKQLLFNSSVDHPVKGTFLTWSDWDLSVCLQYECKRKQILKPAYLNSWIDIRATYRNFYSRKPNGLNGGLQDLGIAFSGRQHSGIDDARNTALLAWRMIQDGCVLNNTKTLKVLIANPVGKAVPTPHSSNTIPPKTNLPSKGDQINKLFKRPLSSYTNGNMQSVFLSPTRKQAKGSSKICETETQTDKPTGVRRLQDRTNIQPGHCQRFVNTSGTQGSSHKFKENSSTIYEKNVSMKTSVIDKENVQLYRDDMELGNSSWTRNTKSGASTKPLVNRCLSKPQTNTEGSGCRLTSVQNKMTIESSASTVKPRLSSSTKKQTLHSNRSKTQHLTTVQIYEDKSRLAKSETQLSNNHNNQQFKSPVLPQPKNRESLTTGTAQSEVNNKPLINTALAISDKTNNPNLRKPGVFQSNNIKNCSTLNVTPQTEMTALSDNHSKQVFNSCERVDHMSNSKNTSSNNTVTVQSVITNIQPGCPIKTQETSLTVSPAFTSNKQWVNNTGNRTPPIVGCVDQRRPSTVTPPNNNPKPFSYGITPTVVNSVGQSGPSTVTPPNNNPKPFSYGITPTVVNSVGQRRPSTVTPPNNNPKPVSYGITPTVVNSVGQKRPSTVTPPSNNPKAPSYGITPPLCLCGKRSKKRIVQSPGPNQGRYFFSCPQGRRPDFSCASKKTSCKFFKWETLITQKSNFTPAPFRNAMSTGHLRKPISRVFRPQGGAQTPRY